MISTSHPIDIQSHSNVSAAKPPPAIPDPHPQFPEAVTLLVITKGFRIDAQERFSFSLILL
jgi:hypothetical protein